MATSVDDARAQRQAIRDAAAAHGRDPDTVAVLPGLSLTLAETREAAEALADAAPGARHWGVAGTADDAVREIEAWSEAIDGFIALPAGSVASVDIFLREVLPRLPGRTLLRLPAR